MEKDLNEREKKERIERENESHSITVDRNKMKDVCKETEAVIWRGKSVTCAASWCVNFRGTTVAKNRVHINRHWSVFYCPNDKVASISMSFISLG